MRSNLITVVSAVASVLLVAPLASADQVQEQLRLMEQRMAEMEDRLEATSTELQTAKTTVNEQQALLTEAGLADNEGEGLRSAVGNFFEEIDVNGVAAAGFNWRILDHGDNNLSNNGLSRHPDANTFTLDQLWVSLDKEATEENRAGFHADFISGITARQHSTNTGTSAVSNEEVYVYSATVSYLADVGNGVQVDLGRQATRLGSESLKTDENFNITQGRVWQMQPVTYTGLTLSTQLTDEIGVAAGVYNDIFSDTTIDDSTDKAYYGEINYTGESFGIQVSNIIGKNTNGGLINRAGGACASNEECKTNVFNTVITAQPTENLSLWADFTWVKNFGRQNQSDGDAYGVAAAGQLGVTDTIDVAYRFEYVRMESAYNRGVGSTNQLTDLITSTWTLSKALTDCLQLRTELRYDHILSNNTNLFANGQNGGTTDRDDQLVALAELVYSF